MSRPPAQERACGPVPSSTSPFNLASPFPMRPCSSTPHLSHPSSSSPRLVCLQSPDLQVLLQLLCTPAPAPASHRHQQERSNAASSTTSSASPVKRQDEHGSHPGPAPGARCVWSVTRPSQPNCPRLSTSTTLATLTSRRLHCGFQDFRLRFCTQEKGNCPGQTGALPVDGCGPGPISN